LDLYVQETLAEAEPDGAFSGFFFGEHLLDQ
jgi:hypothetical protein